MNNRRKQLMLASAKEYCKCVVNGNTLKYNQLANIVNKQAEVIQGLTISTTNGLIKINGTSTTGNSYFDYQIAEYSYTGFKANHKYFIWLQQSNNGRVFLVVGSPYNEINESPTIFTCTSSQYLILRVATNGLTYDNYCVRVNVIDLTELGLGSITSASEFFATDLGKYIKKGNYLPFSSGEFIHSQSPINFNGVNIWNEQWEVGYLNLSNGQNAYGTDEIRSVDYIKAIPNTTYYHTFIGRICYYDKDKNYIGNSDYVLAGTITTPMNCEFIRFYTSDYGNTYLNNICINISNANYNGKYYKYCGTNALMEGLTLQKGDTYKTYSVDSVEYNQKVNPNSVTTSGTLNANGYADLFNFSVDSSQKLVLAFNVSLSGSDISNCTIQLINTYQEVHTTIVNGIAYLYIETHSNLSSDSLYLRLWNYGASNVTFSNVKANIINLTQLGLENVNSVADFKKTKLGIFLSKGYFLPFTLTNKTIKDQIVRTMKEIDLSTLTWTYNSYINAWQSDLSSLFVKSYAGSVLPSAIAEKYRTIKYNDFSSAVEGDMGLFSTKPILEIKSNDSVNAPSGKVLLELETPETNVWYHLVINNYTEWEQYSGDVYKLDRDLSDLNVFGITADIGENQGDLLFLIGRGNNNDYCYENGYIYIKTDDIQNVWEFDLLINNLPTRMVSRRTIKVESDNGVDMDFTKE